MQDQSLEQSGEDQISLTDPDSRAMAAHTRVSVGYNAQIRPAFQNIGARVSRQRKHNL